MASSPFRSFADRQYDPPPTLPGPDQLELTARQVRLDGRDDTPVHAVAATWSDPWIGVTYRTVCCRVMAKEGDGAILTTRPVNCGPCMRGGS